MRSLPVAGKYKVAIFRALHLGDLLVSAPALRSIRAGFPDAEISLIGLPWARHFAQRFNRYIDRFVDFQGYPGIAEVDPNEEATSAFLRTERSYAYDLVVQMHGSGRVSNAFALELGGKRTAGYYEAARPPGLTLAAPYPTGQPEILRNLALACLLGCPDMGTRLEFPVSPVDRNEADSLLPPDRGMLIGIHPGSKRPAQRWRAENFAHVADALAERYGARIIITGKSGEEAAVLAVEARMSHKPVVLTGKTSLGCLAAILEKLELSISNDTGPAHLAEAVGTPTVRLFGPGDYVRWAPLDDSAHVAVRQDVPCNPCDFWECPIDHRCLNRITVEAVLAHAHALLSRRRVAA